MSQLAVIIIGFNERHNLPDCFRSLANSSYKNFELIFVDNNSTDCSVDFLEKEYPKTKIIRNKGNYGYSKANNIGIRYATKTNAQYFLILNPDTYIDKNCLKNLMGKASSNTIIQPMILIDKKGKTNLINTTGNVLHYFGFSYCNDYKKSANSISKIKQIASASGAALFIPKKLIKKLGGFDEVIYPYHEDLDLCWRARIAGAEIKLIPSAKMWHKYEYGRNKNKIYFAERNRILFMLKNYQLSTIGLLLPSFMLNELLVILFSIKNKWFLKKIKSYGSIVLALGYILNARRRIETIRTVDDSKLKTYFTCSLSYKEVRIPFGQLLNFVYCRYFNLIKKYI